MVWLSSILILLLTGYSLVWLLGMSQRHFVADIAAAWFAGSGYLALASFFWTLGLHQRPALTVSLAALGLPPLLFILFRRRYAEGIRASLSACRSACYCPTAFRAAYVVLAAVAAAILVLIILHGKNTPTNTDDGLKLRAYTPMLVYQGLLNPKAVYLILANGSYASFVPVLGWQLQGSINHFHVNYLQLTVLFFFLLTTFMSGVLRKQPQMGIVAAFLLLSLPLFAYHETSTYLDSTYALMFAAAFLYVVRYCAEPDEVLLKHFLLFTFLTALVKQDGEILALTSLAFGTAMVALGYRRNRKLPWKVLAAAGAVLLLYALVKLTNGGNNLIAGVYHALVRSLGGTPAVEAPPMPGGSWEADVYFFGKASAYSMTDLSNMFFYGLFDSGNFGIVFYVFIASAAYHWRTIWRARLLLPMLLFLALLGEVFVNAVFLHQESTMVQAGLHRYVMAPAVTASVFIGLIWAAADDIVVTEPVASPAPKRRLGKRQRPSA
ncbi:MAG: hypothetical protein ABSE73_24655 [Planctomycetota bacterium]